MVSSEKHAARQTLRQMIRKQYPFTVGIDVDETLAGVMSVAIALYNKEKGTNYTMENHKDWDFKSIGSNYVEMMGFYVDAWKDHSKEIKLLAHPLKLIELGQYFVLDAPSSRDHEGLTGGTYEGLRDFWQRNALDQWLPFFCDATKINKLNLGYPAYVDDSPKLAEAITSRNEGFLLLVTKPYNLYIKESARVLRVDDCDHAADELINAAKKEGKAKCLYQCPEGQALLRGDPNWRSFRQWKPNSPVKAASTKV